MKRLPTNMSSDYPITVDTTYSNGQLRANFRGDKTKVPFGSFHFNALQNGSFLEKESGDFVIIHDHFENTFTVMMKDGLGDDLELLLFRMGSQETQRFSKRMGRHLWRVLQGLDFELEYRQEYSAV